MATAKIGEYTDGIYVWNKARGSGLSSQPAIFPLPPCLAGHPGRSRYADRLRSAFEGALRTSDLKFRSGTKPAGLGWMANAH